MRAFRHRQHYIIHVIEMLKLSSWYVRGLCEPKYIRQLYGKIKRTLWFNLCPFSYASYYFPGDATKYERYKQCAADK